MHGSLKHVPRPRKIRFRRFFAMIKKNRCCCRDGTPPHAVFHCTLGSFVEIGTIRVSGEFDCRRECELIADVAGFKILGRPDPEIPLSEPLSGLLCLLHTFW